MSSGEQGARLWPLHTGHPGRPPPPLAYLLGSQSCRPTNRSVHILEIRKAEVRMFERKGLSLQGWGTGRLMFETHSSDSEKVCVDGRDRSRPREVAQKRTGPWCQKCAERHPRLLKVYLAQGEVRRASHVARDTRHRVTSAARTG